MSQPPHYKTNDLFRPGSETDFNACVGTNGGPYDFDDYSLGYFEAGQALTNAALDRKLTVDLAVYPIIYNYRHAIELGLKFLARVLPALLHQPKASGKATHILIDQWNVVKPLLGLDPRFGGAGAISYVDKVLKDIVQFDPNAEVFRFPADRGGKFYLQNSAHINLVVLGETLEKVHQTFESWFATVSEMHDEMST